MHKAPHELYAQTMIFYKIHVCLGTELGFNTQLGTWYPAETQTTFYVNGMYIGYKIQLSCYAYILKHIFQN